MNAQKTQSVLIVDDHVENLNVLLNVLKPFYRIRAATTGREALNLALSVPPPDLILLDIMMPEMDGYMVCERLKANPMSRNIPVIFITARTHHEDEARGFAVGAVDYVTKPIQPQLLLARVRAQLALAELLRQTCQKLDAQVEQVIQITRERDEHAAYAEHLAHEITRRERAESALRESQARFERLTSRLKDQIIFFSHSIQGDLLYCSEGIKLLDTHLSPEQVTGKNWISIVAWTPESLIRGHEENRQLLTGEKQVSDFEMAYQHTDGKLRYFMIHEYLIHDYNQGFDFIEGVVFDITAQKAQDAQLRTLVQAVEQAQTSIVISDQNGKVLYVNPYFSHISGYSQEEVLGKNPRVLKSGEHDAAFYEQMWNTLTTGQTWRGEIVNRHKDGSLFWEYAAISPILNSSGQIVNYVAVKEDINERKKLERIKQDVEQIMRHDLKSPLNAVIGMPQVLELDNNLTPIQREMIGLIRESGIKMLDMINLSLDLFKIETGRYDYQAQAVDLLELLARLVHTLATAIKRKQVTIQITVNGICPPLPETKVMIAAESRLLFSMLSNLLINAFEASEHGATVAINLDGKNPVQLSIRNSGTVPATIRSDFFQKYKTYGKRGGTGLGTYSAKLMADVMEFQMGMETSDVEQYTLIWIQMPAPE
jgi:PAS domain S-box-containing protein